MDRMLEYLTSKSLTEMAADPRVLFGAGVVLILAILFRWKYVLLFLFAIGAMMTVVRYANLSGGPSEMVADRSMLVFIFGTIVVAVVLIYFLFIRGD